MSPNVGNFVHDLVEMAKAMETLPQVEQALREAEERNREANETINRITADLEQSRSYAASLEQKVRDTEASRDDAEMRFLELDEKTSKVLAHVASIQAAALVVQESLTPPKPQPEPEQVPDHVAIHKWHDSPEVQSDQPSVSQDQSEANPTSDGTANSASTQESSVAEVGPYFGKRYIDVPGYISRLDWLDGGGTNEDYDCRSAN